MSRMSRYTVIHLPGQFHPYAVTCIRPDGWSTDPFSASPRFDTADAARRYIEEMEFAEVPEPQQQ